MKCELCEDEYNEALYKECPEACCKIARLTAENARYKHALERIANDGFRDKYLERIAREALAKEG